MWINSILSHDMLCTHAGSFVPTVRINSSRKSVPIAGMSNRVQRERGTKVQIVVFSPGAGGGRGYHTLKFLCEHVPCQ